LYARVSSKKQANDLERQIELLQKRFPAGEVISDIGSGINYKRPGFTRLVGRICRDEIQEIVVTFKDRLARFGYDLFKQICHEHSVRIMVLSDTNNFSNPSKGDSNTKYEKDTEELQEDLLSIVNVFVARQNGRRAGQLRRARKRQKEEEAPTKQLEENQNVSNKRAKKEITASF